MKIHTIYRVLLLPLLATSVASKKPNVVFILTDDQDSQLGSLSHMPFVQKHLLDQGTEYKSHYCTIALCCPSRVSLLTGKAAHNTNVTEVLPPYGGYPKFISQGLNNNYLPIWLQDSGYNTYYTGKLLNYQHILNYNKPAAAGWTSSDFLLDPFTYDYFNSVWTRDSGIPVSEKGRYITDILAEKALGYIEDATKSDKPFFLGIAPTAPHGSVTLKVDIDALSKLNTSNIKVSDYMEGSHPVPADRHKSLFQDLAVPRTPNFNPDTPSGVSWISKLPKLSQENVDYIDERFRSRLRALQAVDEMVDGVVRRLEELDILDNTYIIYSTDNGYHMGQHRLQPGKRCGFEEDINIPLIIRGPGVPKGESTTVVTTHTDLAPTIFNMIERDLHDDFDGTPIPYTKESLLGGETSRQEHLHVEHWGNTGYVDQEYGSNSSDPALNLANTYKSVRVAGKSFNLYYSVFCNNEQELYNLMDDKYQMNNLMAKSNATMTSSSCLAPNITETSTIGGYTVSEIVPRLDALLMVLKTCKAEACVRPWQVLHPLGGVNNLMDALDPKYNAFYRKSYQTNAVSFSKCEPGQILSSEGSQKALVYEDSAEWETYIY